MQGMISPIEMPSGSPLAFAYETETVQTLIIKTSIVFIFVFVFHGNPAKLTLFVLVLHH